PFHQSAAAHGGHAFALADHDPSKRVNLMFGDSAERWSSFSDRHEAGRVLAKHLQKYAGRPDVIVLALPRGGVPVGYEVARALRVPLDVFVVRKLGVPGYGELAMGAIASGGVRVLNEDVLRHVPVSKNAMEAVSARELVELGRRERIYR